MLKELPASQLAGEPRRRWFADHRFDLIVWFTDSGSICSFQLCYDRRRKQWALTWREEGGFSHQRIDEGEANPTKNQTPILVDDGRFPRDDIVPLLVNEAIEVDAGIIAFVLDKIAGYGMS